MFLDETSNLQVEWDGTPPYWLLQYLVGGVNPFEKIARQIWWSLQRCENHKYLKPPPRYELVSITIH